MTIALLYNPMSGTGRAQRVALRIKSELESSGWGVQMVATQAGDPSRWLRAELESMAAVNAIEALVVAGGDGAVRLAAAESARAGIPLWHAPCGTENLFARAMGMSSSGVAIARALRAGQSRTIDIATANGESFVIMASIGPDAEVVHSLSAGRRGAITHLSYIAPILRAIGSWRPSYVRWSSDGEAEELGRGRVVVANLRDYGMRLNPAANAIADDGLLDVVFLPVASGLALLWWAVLLRFGLHLRQAGVRVRRGRAVELWADPPAPMQLDGDAVGDRAGVARVVLSIASLRLRVLTPVATGSDARIG